MDDSATGEYASKGGFSFSAFAASSISGRGHIAVPGMGFYSAAMEYEHTDIRANAANTDKTADLGNL